jgi:hypothetical protein
MKLFEFGFEISVFSERPVMRRAVAEGDLEAGHPRGVYGHPRGLLGRPSLVDLPVVAGAPLAARLAAQPPARLEARDRLEACGAPAGQPQP